MSSESGDCKVSTKPEKRGSNKQKANLNSDTSQKICHRDEAKKKKKKNSDKNKPKIVPRKLKNKFTKIPKKKFDKRGD
jgi:hypothetical protein